jgi:hypothetical protein
MTHNINRFAQIDDSYPEAGDAAETEPETDNGNMLKPKARYAISTTQ